MLSREEIEQMVDRKIEPIKAEVAAIKAQFGYVDHPVVDNRNILQSLALLENYHASFRLDMENLQLNMEHLEKQLVRFEKRTDEQLIDLKADSTTIKEQLNLVVAMLRRVIPPEEQR
jgi:hypothetical protein